MDDRWAPYLLCGTVGASAIGYALAWRSRKKPVRLLGTAVLGVVAGLALSWLAIEALFIGREIARDPRHGEPGDLVAELIVIVLAAFLVFVEFRIIRAIVKSGREVTAAGKDTALL